MGRLGLRWGLAALALAAAAALLPGSEPGPAATLEPVFPAVAGAPEVVLGSGPPVAQGLTPPGPSVLLLLAAGPAVLLRTRRHTIQHAAAL